MNAKSVALLLAMALPWPVLAAPPEPTTTPPVQVESTASPVTILVSCERGDWPTLQQIAADVGYNVFDPPSHVRHRAIIAGLRACRGGATDVKLVFLGVQQQRQVLALADPR